MSREQKTFRQNLAPVTPERLYKCELVSPISCGIPGFEGARARHWSGTRGDILELNQATAMHFLNNGWVKLLRGEPFPGEELPSLGGEIPDFTKIPATKPQPKIPEKLKVRLLRGDISLGHGITDAKVGNTYTLPTSSAMYLVSVKAVELVNPDEVPQPETKLSVIRAQDPTPPIPGAGESFVAGIDRRLRK